MAASVVSLACPLLPITQNCTWLLALFNFIPMSSRVLKMHRHKRG